MNQDEVEKIKTYHERRSKAWTPTTLSDLTTYKIIELTTSWLTLEQRNRELEEEKKTRDMEIEKLKGQVKMFREKLGYDDADR